MTGGGTDARDLVDAHFPYDGPHSDELTRQAAEVIADLTRYLANATRSPDAVSETATVYAALGSLHTAAYRLEQVIEQLATAAARTAEPGAAAELAAALHDVRLSLNSVETDLNTAHQAAADI